MEFIQRSKIPWAYFTISKVCFWKSYNIALLCYTCLI